MCCIVAENQRILHLCNRFLSDLTLFVFVTHNGVFFGKTHILELREDSMLIKVLDLCVYLKQQKLQCVQLSKFHM